ncbi:MAG TPA: cytochrome b/b6 domain-containing protein [Thermoanaerobaculia bacterium]|nr:cytochrome b/b6 domain-containing protein [Thermoanaerobaculia bacterium]
MELFQKATNPWGQEVLTHIDWSLFWYALLAGVVFVIGHQLLRRRLRASEAAAAPAATGDGGAVVRHGLAARLFHWVMALSMLVLLATGFLPQVGLQFPWVTLHWIFGMLLIASILFHIVHATFFQSLRNIWISMGDVKEWMQEVRHVTGRGEGPKRKPGKYPVDHKLYHHAVTLSGFAAIITGVLMMFRIDTPVWPRNPYLYSDATWGVIYVLHGVGGVLLVTLTFVHVYFAILPEKRWITWSMIHGKIRRSDHLAHHDPERWPGERAGAKGDNPAATAPARAQGG